MLFVSIIYSLQFEYIAYSLAKKYTWPVCDKKEADSLRFIHYYIH